MTERMPTLFIGHGSPMNTIEENEFTQGWREVAEEIPKPGAILCVSAHWYVPYTMLTAMEKPRTIHDFYGFPSELYEQQYPAPGAPELATHISDSIKEYTVGLDQSWGLDHGTWSVLKKMYPKADIPTIQLSIDYSKQSQYHFELARKLSYLRDEGVLIIGSGNLVHNLRAVVWNSKEHVHEWAQQFEESITNSILSNNESVFVHFKNMGDLARKAHPSIDHYLPLIYAIGAGGLKDEPEVYNKKIIHGSISMTCYKFG